MSLKYEQHRALKQTRDFLREIMRGPRMPTKRLRDMAGLCLRHFPLLKESGEPMFSNDDVPPPEGCSQP
jgi:hypothetical protein